MNIETKITDDEAMRSLAQEGIRYCDINEAHPKAAMTLRRIEVIDEHNQARSLPKAIVRAEELRAGTDPANYARIFRKYVHFGINGLQDEERSILYRHRAGAWAQAPVELRAQAGGTGSAGGFLIPESFQAELSKTLKHYSAVRQVARIL